MALLSPQNVVYTGLAPSLSAATATTGDTAVCDGKTFFMVTNASVSSITVTVSSYFTDTVGASHTDNVVTVAAGATKFIAAPIIPFQNPSDTLMKAVCSAVTTVTIGAIRLP